MKYKYKVTGTRLAFRSEPVAKDSTLILRNDTWEILMDTAAENGWVLCEYKGQKGYCMEKYLEKIETIEAKP